MMVTQEVVILNVRKQDGYDSGHYEIYKQLIKWGVSSAFKRKIIGTDCWTVLFLWSPEGQK